jgi:hypothetical protein
MRCKFAAKPGQIESSVDLPHQAQLRLRPTRRREPAGVQVMQNSELSCPKGRRRGDYYSRYPTNRLQVGHPTGFRR